MPAQKRAAHKPRGGVGREVGDVAARFLVGFGACDVQPCEAVGFCGQVLPLKGCDFAAA